MNTLRVKWVMAGLLALAVAPTFAAGTGSDLVQARLDNGLRVVIVRDTLAPVATMEMNYLVGADETPRDFPGTAHAVEHMMFRGSPGLTRAQLLAIGSDLGGAFNAQTEHALTQYFFTVPADDLGIALHIAAIRMRAIGMAAPSWNKECGAIEQEVAGDNSNPGFKFQTQLRAYMFAGTPYAISGLGTRTSFTQTTAAQLKAFHDAWYAPNNAVLVIAGDVDPNATLAEIKDLFGAIPRKTLPPRPAFHFGQVSASTIRLPTDFAVGLAVKAWRMPGIRDKDYPAAVVLATALGSKRGPFFALGATGKALLGSFNGQFMQHAEIGFAAAAFPKSGNATQMLGYINGIMAATASKGVPVDLVAAAKQRLITSFEFLHDSVPSLAGVWSAAIAKDGLHSPAELRDEIAQVTPAEVDALAKHVFDPAHAITAILTPQTSGKPAARTSFGAAESFGGAPQGEVTLPAWAQATFAKLKLPDFMTHPSAFTLSNGLRIIVQPESISKTISVAGVIKTNQDLQAPKGQEGVAGILNALFNFGTTDLDRLQFQAALDAINAQESAGSSFSLAVPAANLAKGMALLADNELHPALPEQAFAIMRRNVAATVAGTLDSPAGLNALALKRELYPASDPILRHGTPRSIAKLTLADVIAYYKQTFRPDMTTIMFIGDITPAEAKKVTEATFGAWKVTGPKPDTDYPAVPANKPSQFTTPNASAVQDSIALAETTPVTESSPDRFALSLGNEILGSGFGSRLTADLRVKHGLVYSVSSSSTLEKNRGAFSISFAADPDNVAEARALALQDLRQMQTAPPSASELLAAKGKMLRKMALSQSSFGSIATYYLTLSTTGKPLDSNLMVRRYMAVTPAQVQATFQHDIRANGFITDVEGPAPK